MGGLPAKGGGSKGIPLSNGRWGYRLLYEIEEKTRKEATYICKKEEGRFTPGAGGKDELLHAREASALRRSSNRFADLGASVALVMRGIRCPSPCGPSPLPLPGGHTVHRGSQQFPAGI